MPTVEELITQRFNASCEPCSDAFKAGFRATLEAHINNVRTFCTYPRGTAESDAFFAGAKEARTFWKKNARNRAGRKALTKRQHKETA